MRREACAAMGLWLSALCACSSPLPRKQIVLWAVTVRSRAI